MFALNQATTRGRIPLREIEAAVATRLGAGRERQRAAVGVQPSGCDVPSQSGGRLEHNSDRKVLQRPGSFDGLLCH